VRLVMKHESPFILRARSSLNIVPTPKTARGRETRAKLLAAAEAAFAEKDYHGTSIADMTQNAGIAMGTFYLHFPDKLAVFREVVRNLNQALRDQLREAVAPARTRLEVEQAGFEAFFRFVLQHRNLYRIVQQAETVDAELYRWYYRRLAEGYVEALENSMEKGEVKRLSAECLAYCLMGMGHFVGMRWPLWEGRQPPRAEMETLHELIRAGMFANTESGRPPGDRTKALRAKGPAAPKRPKDKKKKETSR
jgi:AcrR family transcriptional regulator